MTSRLREALAHVAQQEGLSLTEPHRTRLFTELLAAGTDPDSGRALGHAREWGRGLAARGKGIDEATASVWDAFQQVEHCLLVEMRGHPEDMEAAVGELVELGERVAAAVVQGYTAVKEEMVVKEREELLWLAAHDGLTGLYNQRFFDQRLGEELARAERYGHQMSILMLDVDYFKLYNDTFGHLMGNEVLKGLAAAVSGAVRRSDFVARYGGEEYVVVLPETDAAGALVAAERIREATAGLSFSGMESQPLGRITVSLGCATYPQDGRAAVDLIRAADTALYAAKHQGRDRVCAYVPAKDQEEKDRG